MTFTDAGDPSSPAKKVALKCVCSCIHHQIGNQQPPTKEREAYDDANANEQMEMEKMEMEKMHLHVNAKETEWTEKTVLGSKVLEVSRSRYDW